MGFPSREHDLQAKTITSPGLCGCVCSWVCACACASVCLYMHSYGDQRATSAISPQAQTALHSGMTLLTMPRYFHHQVGTCTGWQNLESPYLHSLRCRCQGCTMPSDFHTRTERSRRCSLHLVNRLPKVDILTLDCMEVQLWHLLTDGL